MEAILLIAANQIIAIVLAVISVGLINKKIILSEEFIYPINIFNIDPLLMIVCIFAFAAVFCTIALLRMRREFSKPLTEIIKND